MSGYFPCFARYRNGTAPLSEVYDDPMYVRRVKEFVSEIIECRSPQEVKQKIGAHEIKPIRPNSGEDKKVIRTVSDSTTTLYKLNHVHFDLTTSYTTK